MRFKKFNKYCAHNRSQRHTQPYIPVLSKKENTLAIRGVRHILKITTNIYTFLNPKTKFTKGNDLAIFLFFSDK